MSKKFSQLPVMTTVSSGDYLMVNDGNTDTRRILFQNFSSKFVRTDQSSEVTGNLTLSGVLVAEGIFLRSPVLYVNPETEQIGIGTTSPERKVDVHGDVQISNGNTVRFADLTNSNGITFQAPTLLESSAYSFPESAPTVTNSVLACDPDGDMFWMATSSSQSSGSQVMVLVPTPPTTSGSPGNPGEFAVDNDFIYVCRAQDVWARAPIDGSAW